jgi:hypothetical protein
MNDCRADYENASHRRKSVSIITATLRRVVSRDSAYDTRPRVIDLFSVIGRRDIPGKYAVRTSVGAGSRYGVTKRRSAESRKE